MFRRFRKSTISFVMPFCVSVCLSVPTEQRVSQWTDFHEILYLSNFLKSLQKFTKSANQHMHTLNFLFIKINNKLINKKFKVCMCWFADWVTLWSARCKYKMNFTERLSLNLAIITSTLDLYKEQCTFMIISRSILLRMRNIISPVFYFFLVSRNVLEGLTETEL